MGRLGRVGTVREQRHLMHHRGRHNLSRGHLLHRLDGLLILLKEGLVVVRHFELGLHLPDLLPGHLDVAVHLLPRPRLVGL